MQTQLALLEIQTFERIITLGMQSRAWYNAVAREQPPEHHFSHPHGAAEALQRIELFDQASWTALPITMLW